MLFEAEETCQLNEFTPSKISDRATEREEPCFVCWPGQPMVKGEPVVDFDTPMKEFMEGERYPQSLIEKAGYHWREAMDSYHINALL